MKLSFKPSKFSERLNWFVSIPFYSLNDFLSGSPLVVESSDISEIIQFSKYKTDCFIIKFDNKIMTGEFATSQLPASAQENVAVREIASTELNAEFKKRFRSSLLQQITQFYKRSPMMTYIATLLVVTPAIDYLRPLLHDFLASKAAPACASKCVSAVTHVYLSFGYSVFALLIAPLFFAALFFFVIPGKHRNFNQQQAIKTEAILLGLVTLYLSLSLAQSPTGQHLYANIGKVNSALIGQTPFNEALEPVSKKPVTRETSSEKSE